jgi:hypothetical protein
MAPIDGRRKTIILVSQGVPAGLPALPNENRPRPLSSTWDAMRPSPGALDLRDVIDAAAHNNVSFYTIDPTGDPGAPAPDIKPVPYLLGDSPFVRTSGQETLDVLAAETGGASLIRSNNFDDAFARIVEESSSYYLLGYTSSGKRDGKFHHIAVRTRAGLRVRTRTGYVAQNDKPTKPVKPGGWPPELVNALQSPVQISGVKMNVGAAAFRGENGTASVEVVVETHGADLLKDADATHTDGSVGLLIVAVDSDGHIKASHYGGLAMHLSPDTRDAVDSYGLRMLNRLALKPGHYVMRVAGVDQAAATKGSVQYMLDVPDFSKGPLTMSGLVVSSTAENRRPTTGSDNDWKARFGEPPTATRAFAASDDLVVFDEIYQNDEKSGRIDVMTTVQSESDDIVFRQQQELASGAGAPPGPSKSYPNQTTIPLKDLKPGNYLLVVESRATANPKASVSRQVFFSVH